MTRPDALAHTEHVDSRGIRRLVAAGVGVAVALAISAGAWAYGHREQPVGSSDGFELQPGDHRVVGLYRLDSRRLERDVSLPTGTRHVRVRVDCVGSTAHGVSVALHASGPHALTGRIWLPCQDSSQPGGYIGIDKGRAMSAAQTTRVTFVAPRGAHWSAVLDAGPGKIDPALDVPSE